MGSVPSPFVQDLLDFTPIRKENIYSVGWHGNAFDFIIYKKGISSNYTNNIPDGSDTAFLREYEPEQKFARAANGGSLKAFWWYYINSPLDKLPTVEQLKTALIEHGRLAAPIYYDECLGNHRGDVFNETDLGIIDHVVLLVGWDDKKQHG